MWKWLIGATVGLGLVALGAVARAATRRSETESGAGRVTVRGHTIYGPGNFVYRLTDDDLLWLARAIWGESGADNETGGAAVAWAMVQYHALVIGRTGGRPAFSTFASLLRAYCQPINPKWASLNASGCREHPDRCTETLLRRRAMITSAAWGSIPETPKRVVERLIAGSLSNPVPGLTDWAAYEWQRGSQVPLVNVRGNRFGVGSSRRLYRGA